MVRSIDPRCETLRGTHWPPRGRLIVWNSRRGTHLGQRSMRPHQQAGHMDASDPIRHSKPLASTGAVHIWVLAFASTTSNVLRHQKTSAFSLSSPGLPPSLKLRRAWDSWPRRSLGVDGTGRSSIPETMVLERISRGVLDRPPSRAMTGVGGDVASRSRDMKRPSFASRPPSPRQRAQGKPGADRTHGPRAKDRKHGGRTTGVTGYSGFPCAMGYGLLRALPGETWLFCHRLRKTQSRL